MGATSDFSDLREVLKRGADALRVPVTDQHMTQLLDYVALLAKWNRAFNLTAIRQPSRMVTEHVLDALSIADRVVGHRVIDVGTGAGLPGLVLAILNPERDTVLLDANGKKTRFLKEAARTLGLRRVHVHHGRCEAFSPDTPFDTVMCRAFAPLPRLVALAAHLRSDDGIILAQKGLYPDEEVAALGDRWHVDSARIHVPGVAKTRHVLTLRPGPTP